MKYVLALQIDESQRPAFDPEQFQEVMKAWDAYTNELRDAGVFIAGEGLQPSETATTLQLQPGGEPIVSDGPYAETKEQLGGFYLLDCADLDEVIGWAKKLPMPGGVCEIRPVLDYEAGGSSVHTNSAEAVA